jgi:hypothetical protein
VKAKPIDRLEGFRDSDVKETKHPNWDPDVV